MHRPSNHTLLTLLLAGFSSVFLLGAPGCARAESDDPSESESEESAEAEGDDENQSSDDDSEDKSPPDPNAGCKDYLRGVWSWGGIVASFDGGALVVTYDGDTRVVGIVFLECDPGDSATIQGDGYIVDIEFTDEDHVRLTNELFPGRSLMLKRKTKKGVKARPDKKPEDKGDEANEGDEADEGDKANEGDEED